MPSSPFKYKLQFFAQAVGGGHKSVSMAVLDDELFNYHLSYYLLNQPIDYLTNDVLPELDKALAGQPFDSDAGGTLSFLTIGPVQSTFSGIDEARADISVSTTDLREIIAQWTQWVVANKLQDWV
ncbi:hypothetical protein [Mucilaginibacter sp. CSA2-8R]|uniref:hypothetical protein n=1 Tax=Mucilaginibacter sp. CSA2-8R TaxID=3141542 RepID=UPI00315DFE08